MHFIKQLLQYSLMAGLFFIAAYISYGNTHSVTLYIKPFFEITLPAWMFIFSLMSLGFICGILIAQGKLIQKSIELRKAKQHNASE